VGPKKPGTAVDKGLGPQVTAGHDRTSDRTEQFAAKLTSRLVGAVADSLTTFQPITLTVFVAHDVAAYRAPGGIKGLTRRSRTMRG
jgi:hypothetical protein